MYKFRYYIYSDNIHIYTGINSEINSDNIHISNIVST